MNGYTSGSQAVLTTASGIGEGQLEGDMENIGKLE